MLEQVLILLQRLVLVLLLLWMNVVYPFVLVSRKCSSSLLSCKAMAFPESCRQRHISWNSGSFTAMDEGWELFIQSH